MAITLTDAALAAALSTDAPTAARLLPVATALVDRHAPGAPEAIANEAAIRTAGWLFGSPPALTAHRSIEAGGDAVKIEPRNPAASALRASGAAALLSPWRIRRAVRSEVAS